MSRIVAVQKATMNVSAAPSPIVIPSQVAAIELNVPDVAARL